MLFTCPKIKAPLNRGCRNKNIHENLYQCLAPANHNGISTSINVLSLHCAG